MAAIYLGDISFGLGPDVARILAARRAILSFGQAVDDAAVRMSLGFAAGLVVFQRIAGAAIATAKQIQQVTLALNAVNTQQRTTQVELSYLMNLSDRTGVAFSELSHQFVQLNAASAGTSLAGEKTREIFEDITFSAAKLGLSSYQVSHALLAIQQAMNKGRIEAQEWRQQLGNDLPGAYQVLARSMNVSVDQLQKMMKQGKVSSDALLGFAREYAKSMGVDVKGSIDTVYAAEGRLSNAWIRFNEAMDTSIGFSRAYTNGLNTMISVIDQVGQHLNTILKILGTLGIGLAVAFAPGIILAFGNAVRTATLLMLGLNAAAVANPFVFLGTLILRLTLLIGGMIVGMQVMNSLLGSDTPSAADQMTTSIGQNALALADASTKSKAYQDELRTQIQLQLDAAHASLEQAGAAYQAAAANAAKAGDFARFMNIIGSATGQGTDDKRAEDYKGQIMGGALAGVNQALTNLNTLQAQFDKINAIIAKGGKTGSGSGSGDGITHTAAELLAMAKASRDAEQAIGDLAVQYQTLTAAPAQAQLMRVQQDLNKQIREYHDRLVDAKLPLEQVNQLTALYAANASKLAMMQYQLAAFPNLFTQLGQTLGNALDSGMGQFIDDVSSGKDALSSLSSIGRAVALDLIKTFAQLAVLNPLKNLLGIDAGGGTGFPTFNIGSFIGQMLSGGGLQGGIGNPAVPVNASGGWGAAANGLLHFASGGSFRIGGSGGQDSQMVKFMGSPGEVVNVSHGDSGSGSSSNAGIGDVHVHLHGENFGNKEIADAVQQGLAAGFEMIKKTDTPRVHAAIVRGRLNNMPGMRTR